MKHGPIALIDESVPVIVCAPSGPLFDKTLSNVQEVIARGGRVVLCQAAVAAEDVSSSSGGRDGDRGRRGPCGVGCVPRRRRAVGLLSLRPGRGVVEAFTAVEL